jgi:uncharacterized membrane protein
MFTSLMQPLKEKPRVMNSISTRERSIAAEAVYGLLDPIPFGCFVAALIFDVVYARGGDLMWDKGAAWLLVIGLFAAIVPRLINLVQVWITGSRRGPAAEKLDFWMNLLAVVAAIVNSFVHSRDAYAVVPAGVWLSACTVFLLAIGHVLRSIQRAPRGSQFHA